MMRKLEAYFQQFLFCGNNSKLRHPYLCNPTHFMSLVSVVLKPLLVGEAGKVEVLKTA